MNLDSEFRGLPVEEAVFYARLGLQLELFSLADISDWIDEVLLREDNPNEFFLGFYRILHTNKLEVPAYLKNLFPDVFFSVRPALCWLHRQLISGKWPMRQLIKSLYRLRTLVKADVEVGWIYGLAADYDRAVATTPEAMLEVEQDTDAFLACYQDYTFGNRSYWQSLDVLLEQRWANLRQ
ncbi:hypothetical protein [Hymenobacter volaticus]|uniref:DUF4375 domain-containing protein n=1 Tax=Hymenobacter volaticus TaxID=2932254 RepID=A0ABY4G1D4_9BACT|nr:hypothetical protein [Hymenobacter volaticus]UOQ64673.1 hypothetical protein MUN86_13945 [Hymenobacter volaticus]